MSKRFLLQISLIIISILTISSQMTKKETNNIIKLVKNAQATNGLVSNSLDLTLKAVSILKLLSEEVPYKQKICSYLAKFVVEKSVNVTHIELSKALDCQLKFSDVKINESGLEQMNIKDLLNEVKLADLSGADVDWDKILKTVFKFYGRSKFTKKIGIKAKSIYATSLGIEILGIIHKHVDENSKNKIASEFSTIFNELQSANQEMSPEVLVYVEKGAPAYLLNYHIIKSLSFVKDISAFPKYKDTLHKLLNYFLAFKYEAYDIENIFYRLEVFKIVDYVPAIRIENNIFEYGNKNELEVSFVDSFGKSLKLSDYTLKYQIKKVEQEKPSKKSSDDNYDLDDDEEEKSKLKVIKGTLDVKDQNKAKINLKDIFIEKGKYKAELALVSSNSKIKVKKVEKLILMAELEINSLKFKIENTADSSLKESEQQLEYPNRSFRNFQANQDSILILNTVITSEDKSNKPVEQVFLRLQHKDTEKIYSSYATKFNPDTHEYEVQFLIDDPANIDSYNGEYQLAIFASSPYSKESKSWVFGTVNINFRKPMDPSYTPRFKNEMKEKMLPTFTHEMKLDPNYVFSFLFCGLIIATFVCLLYAIKNNGANVDNFPNESGKAIYSLFLIILLFFFGLLMILFWLKLNILQTLTTFAVLFIPGILVIYNAMKSVEVDV